MWRSLLFMGGFFVGTVTQDAIPHHELTVRQIVETLADYDVIHAEETPGAPPAYGLTDFDRHRIYIFDASDYIGKRQTVIHEMYHIYYRSIGLEPPDEFIRQEENEEYARLFGTPNHAGTANSTGSIITIAPATIICSSTSQPGCEGTGK